MRTQNFLAILNLSMLILKSIPVTLNRVQGDNKKCRRRDSNPQGVNHTNLNRARLPIPPLRHQFSVQFVFLPPVSLWRMLSSATLSQNNSQDCFVRQSATSTSIFCLICISSASSFVADVVFDNTINYKQNSKFFK